MNHTGITSKYCIKEKKSSYVIRRKKKNDDLPFCSFISAFSCLYF